MLLDNTTLLKVGTTPYTKVFQGATQIWPKVVSGAYTPNPINNSTAALPLPTTGTNYFISNSGSTSNTGLSDTSPWPISKVQQGYAGQFFTNANILFRAGETFYGTVYIAASGTVRYQSYGAGPRPILTTMRIVPGSNITSNWTLTSYTNVWKLAIGGLGLQFRPRIWLNDVEGTRAYYPQDVNTNYRVSYTNDGTNGQAIYLYAPINPATFYTSIKSPNFDQSTLQIETALTFVKNLDVRGATGSSIDVISTATGSIIEDCVIGLDSNGSGVRFSNIDGFEVRNNDFKTGYITKGVNGFYDGSEGGDCISLYAYNSLKNINVHHNNFYDWIHSSFWVEQQGGADKPMVNLQFRYNFSTSPNCHYARGFGCYGWLNNTNSVYVENNVFYDFQIQNQMACPGLFVRYNTVDSFYNGDRVRENTGSGNGLQLGHGTYIGQNMTITDNNIKNCEQTGIALSGELSYDPTSTIPKEKNNIISRNTFTNNGSNVYTHPDYEPPGYPLRTEHNVDLYIYHRFVIENNTFQDNVFNGRSSTDKPIFYGHDPSGNYLKTTAQFNAMNGTAGDVISGNSITLT